MNNVNNINRHVVIYYFVHPTFDNYKQSFLRKQLTNISNIKNLSVKEIVIVTSDVMPGEGIHVNLPDDLKHDVIKQMKPEANYIYNKIDEAIGLHKGYESFLDNGYDILTGVYENIDEIPMNIIHYTNNENLHNDGLLTGIGPKRFLSQVHHILNHKDTYYIAIDDYSILYSLEKLDVNGNLVKMPRYSNSSRFSDSLRGDGSNPICITYKEGIDLFFNFIKKQDDHNFLFGFNKASSEPNFNENKIRIEKNYSIYKFLIMDYIAISSVFYDPFCVNFKEDVEWIYRSYHNHITGIKYPKCVVCKADKFKINCYYPYEESKLLKIPEKISHDAERKPNNKYLYYIYSYARMLLSEKFYVNYYVLSRKNNSYVIAGLVPGNNNLKNLNIFNINNLLNVSKTDPKLKGKYRVILEDEYGLYEAPIIPDITRNNDVDSGNKYCGMSGYGIKDLDLLINIGAFFYGYFFNDEINNECEFDGEIISDMYRFFNYINTSNTIDGKIYVGNNFHKVLVNLKFNPGIFNMRPTTIIKQIGNDYYDIPKIIGSSNDFGTNYAYGEIKDILGTSYHKLFNNKQNIFAPLSCDMIDLFKYPLKKDTNVLEKDKREVKPNKREVKPNNMVIRTTKNRRDEHNKSRKQKQNTAMKQRRGITGGKKTKKLKKQNKKLKKQNKKTKTKTKNKTKK